MRALLRVAQAVALSIALLTAGLAGGAAKAAEISWIGGTDDLWHTPTNWSSIEIGDPPQMVQRAPVDGDDVFIGDPTNGTFVRLDADSAVLGSLTMSGGMDLDTAGSLLQIGDNMGGATTINGSGTTLLVGARHVPPEYHLVAFTTGDLHVMDGGKLHLENALADVRNRVTIAEQSLITAADGRVMVGLANTSSGSTVLVNDGIISPVRGKYLWFETHDGLLFDLDGASDEGILDLGNHGSLLSVPGRGEPFNGTLNMGNGALSASPTLVFDGAMIQIDNEGGRPGATFWGAYVLDGGTEIAAKSDVTIDGDIQVLNGTVRVEGYLRMLCSDVDNGCDQIFGPESRLLLEDGSRLNVPATANISPNVEIRSQDLDLDGENGDVAINVGYFQEVVINAPALDNDPLSPGFDGTFTLAGRLTVDVGDGWEVDGRLELQAIEAAAQLYGTPITVDGGEPGDGLYIGGRDYDNSYEITIHTDVAFTENGRLGITEELGYLRMTRSLHANGTLEYIKLFDNYQPPVGTVHRLLDAGGGISGRFASLDFFPLRTGRAWYIAYNERSISAHVVEAVPGEFNGDGVVDQQDLDLVLANWGRDAAEVPAGWVNDLPSGVIDQTELDRVLVGWGDQVILPSETAAARVPEPATWVLGLVASVIIWRRNAVQIFRRRCRFPLQKIRAQVLSEAGRRKK